MSEVAEHPIYDVKCGQCAKPEQVTAPTRAHAERELRIKGWKKTAKHGWVCGCGGEQSQEGPHE